ncbi:hypothetical protein [Pseudosulfitobacter pseudonitzschiae]|uniref:hypothetical protein n=1 Tax=Pseudosulfitobacter pseudonitzschiae TaxID=1402135 RepID=UPI001AF1734C|nr:hypothetical protein [Pseudosulfitobacter pseudonitzschiae]MBM1814874.1 hypothetical protein [Pseudosulfitobacter pseudonitzschiae]MBM1831868.1 hypothetical protein [Pseudosulfitobacter pseudonitzschiae]MBM1836733.1 hypothetical protein [Pseudosulfitobacter pseudonitzschiae]MBM1841580.1 hypothetical protein [Pseudosulfitobacter pseudonitzschiae]MBM1846447.1 hypothetical protein [Pseudosulfitobacter pseudonitzschiae]
MAETAKLETKVSSGVSHLTISPDALHSTIEPSIVARQDVLYLEQDESWFEQRLARVETRSRGMPTDLSLRLGNADWLDGDLSAGDLMTVDVLRRLGGSELLEDVPNLSAYVARAEARPAFRRAYGAQRDFFNSSAAG